MGGKISNQIKYKSNDDSGLYSDSISIFHFISKITKKKSNRKGSEPIFLKKNIDQYLQQITNENNKNMQINNIDNSNIKNNKIIYNQNLENENEKKNIQNSKNNNFQKEKIINDLNVNFSEKNIYQNNIIKEKSEINKNIVKLFKERINKKEASYKKLTQSTENKINNSVIIYSKSIEDYELNFYRNGDEIRSSYITKLICKKIWSPSSKNKTHNSLIIFDWDDTLLCTTYLNKNNLVDDNIILSEKDKEKISKLEKSVYNLLSISIEKGDVFIITNAGAGWVEFSSQKYYPSILELLTKIKIISAREEYEYLFPDDPRMWKIQSFLNMQKFFNSNLVTNIICLGDSFIEIEAGKFLASKFNQAYIKTVKFREFPKPDELNKQLNLVYNQFDIIYKSIKNLTIRVEKKTN
jgi:hypothetical protein